MTLETRGSVGVADTAPVDPIAALLPAASSVAPGHRTVSELRPWTVAELAAIEVLRGRMQGTVIEDELVTPEGIPTSQTVVTTSYGAVTLHSWVPDGEVPAEHRLRVRQIVNRVCRRLNLPPVVVKYLGPPRWIDGGEILMHQVNPLHPGFDKPAEPGTQRACAGVTSPRLPWTICLNLALSGDTLTRAVAHELRHCDQLWGRATHVPDDERERELDAIAFEESWMEHQG